jgi:hypothetical protein
MTQGDYIQSNPSEIYPHKRFFAFGRFHYWLVPSLGVRETESIVFQMRLGSSSRQPVLLHFGAAVLRREIRERVINAADDQILVKQYI